MPASGPSPCVTSSTSGATPLTTCSSSFRSPRLPTPSSWPAAWRTTAMRSTPSSPSSPTGGRSTAGRSSTATCCALPSTSSAGGPTSRSASPSAKPSTWPSGTPPTIPAGSSTACWPVSESTSGREMGALDAPTIADPDVDETVETAKPWVVVVWNDPVNLMSYVVYVFQKLFGYSREKATKLMLDVHHKGKAAVSFGTREKAEVDVSRLHAHGLWATMQRD